MVETKSSSFVSDRSFDELRRMRIRSIELAAMAWPSTSLSLLGFDGQSNLRQSIIRTRPILLRFFERKI